MAAFVTGSSFRGIAVRAQRTCQRRSMVTKMGVEVETLKPGDGSTFPEAGSMVTVHYVGTLTDGSKFDSSRDRGSPFQFTIGIGQVIRGWDEGVMKMSVGELAKLTCSPDFGYGAMGYPPVIPGNATLEFEVELLGVK